MRRPKSCILFERIDLFNLCFVLFHALSGRAVYRIDLSKFVERSSTCLWILSKLGVRARAIKYVSKVHGFAIDVSDEQVDQFRRHPIVRRLSAAFDSQEFYLPFKKRYTEIIFSYLMLVDTAQKLAKESGEETVAVYPWRIPEEESRCLKFLAGEHSSAVQVSRLAKAWSVLSSVFGRVTSVIKLSLFPLWLLKSISRVQRKDVVAERFRNCVTVFGVEWLLGHERGVELWFDGKNFTKQNTVLYIDYGTPATLGDELAREGYPYFLLQDTLRRVDLRFVLDAIVRKVLPTWFSCCLRLFLQREMYSEVTFLFFTTITYWMAVLRKFRFENFIVYSDATLSGMIRNSYLKTCGIRSVLVDHSSAFVDTFTPLGTQVYRHVLYSDQNYSDYFCWGEKNKRYYIENGCRPGRFSMIGCIWSEQARCVSDAQVEQLKCDLEKAFGNIENRKIIVVFDTSIGGAAILNCEDLDAFIRGVRQLLSDIPNSIVIFKMKKGLPILAQDGVEPEIVRIYERLVQSKDIYVIDDGQIPVAPVMAIADITISACFTSPATEALGAGKKAVFFDATNRFSGTYYDRFPNLVAHSYNELKHLIKLWLFETSQEEFKEYVNKWVAGELDAHCDGKALTRARQFFSGGDDRESIEALWFRKATMLDLELLLEWYNDPVTRANSLSPEPVDRKKHEHWLRSSLEDADRLLYIAELSNQPVGTVRFDQRTSAWEMSWTVAPTARGKGIGKKLVRDAAKLVPGKLIARVKSGNAASLRIADYAGFHTVERSGELLTLVLTR